MRVRYASDDRPGVSRRPTGQHFVYRTARGRVVRDPEVLARIRRLAIPPAWTNVWIASDPLSHIQATGRDARGRKQYRYHAAWTAARDRAKYDHVIDFARVLPIVRRQVSRDLEAAPLSRARVLATVVALLERTHIRVGNSEYARQNGSYGLTTMQNRHVQVRGGRIEFKFRGKSGIHHSITVDDPRLAREVRRCQTLPGQTLFEYRDPKGRVRRVGSADVNAYLAAAGGSDVTAKDFRTWWGTVAACVQLRQAPPATTAAGVKRNILAAIDDVAGQLGNTRATCRKCYIHPAVIDAYARGISMGPRPHDARRISGLSSDEHAVLDLLEAMRRRPAAQPSARRSRRSGTKSPATAAA